MSAVTAPSGSSVPGSTRWAIRSDPTISAAPASPAIATTAMPGARSSPRARWGAMNATNATGPASATESAARHTPTASSRSRSASTLEPRPVAVSSPRARAGSGRSMVSVTTTSRTNTTSAGMTSVQSVPYMLPTVQRNASWVAKANRVRVSA